MKYSNRFSQIIGIFINLISIGSIHALYTQRISYSVVKSTTRDTVSFFRQSHSSIRRRGSIEMINKRNLSPPRIIIAGAPAAGKGSQCEMLKSKFGLVHLSTGDILRAAVKEGTPLGMKAKAFMDGGQLVPDELITGVICDRLKEKDCETKGWLLDGFPRTKSQAEALTANGIVPDNVVMLDVPEDILLERVTGRRTDPATGKIYHMKFSPPENDEVASRLVQRSDDTAEKITIRYKEFQNHINDIQSCYIDRMVRIDGTLSQSEVSKCIAAVLDTTANLKYDQNIAKGNSNASKRAGLFNLQGGFTDNSASTKSSKSSKISTAIGIVTLIIMDKVMASLFKSKKLTFPSSLAAMVGVFLALCDLKKYNADLAERISDGLSPSVSLIKAWLPLFFVPPLVVLPLKLYLLKGVGFQLLAVILIGSFLSLTSAGLFAQLMNGIFPENIDINSPVAAVKTAPLPTLPPLYIPTIATITLLAVSKLLPSRSPVVPVVLRNILQTAYGSAASVTGYIAGTKLPTNMKKIAHPVLTCAVVTTILLSVFGLLNGIAPAAVLSQYFGSGSMNGAGDIISSMLGPAIISFGIQLYQYRVMLKQNAARVLTTTAFSASFGLTSSAILAKAFSLAPAQTALAPLTRCITTPLALAGARLTGADPSLSAFVVVITGILGASLGESLLESVGVKEPVSVGLAVGAGAHGLGAAAMASDPVKFASAVVSMTLTGLWTVALMSCAPILKGLVKLTL